MQLFVYSDFDLTVRIGVIDDIVSLTWTRRYWNVGEFELVCPNTEHNRKLLRRNRIIDKQDSPESGIIEQVRFEENKYSADVIRANGRFLSCIFDRRTTGAMQNFKNKQGSYIIRTMIQNASEFFGLSMGKNVTTSTLNLQVTYKNLLSYISKVAQYCGIGYRITANYDEMFNKYKFDLYKGVDRSNPASNGYVEFSERFENISDVSYTMNDSEYKNVYTVGGLGEGDERKYVTVIRDEEQSWALRREGFSSATDISNNGLTEDEYLDALRQRANEKLDIYQLNESYEFEVCSDVNFKYKTDWDIGDIVAVKKESWGLSSNLRIIEINEIYEHEQVKIVPTLGNPLPTSIDWEV